MNNKEGYFLLLRYLSLIILGLFNLSLFYTILTPLTVYPSFYILSLFYDVSLLPGNVLSYQGMFAQIIPACIAGAAYYLLLILNLTTPMRLEKRIYSIAYLFIFFLALNIIRIVLFAVLFAKGFQFFDFAHVFSWYFGSTLLVVLLWFTNIEIFKIRSIPVYTDIKKVFSDTKFKG